MQFFKGDDDELKYYNSGSPVLEIFSSDKDDFLQGYSETEPLGALIFDSGRSPLSNAINREIFKTSFKQLFQSFVEVGTFEAYIAVFKKIFGDEATVEFTVPAAGKLNIDITADGIELSNFVARSISNNNYIYDNVVDDEDDQIVFQTIKGFQSQYELEQMLFEMVPGGVFTDITLTLGE